MCVAVMKIRLCAFLTLFILGLFLSTSIYSQYAVKGKVTDELGRPLGSATVSEK